MSVINLSKGQKIDLTKTNPGLKNVLVGLGWDTNRYSGGEDFDLDASAFIVDGNGKAFNEKSFIFYNNLQSEEGSVIHTGDNRTGDGDGDDEQLLVKLPIVPNAVQKVVFTVTIHDAEQRKQNFGQVSNAFIRIVNEDTNEEIVRYDLGEDFSIETALVVGEIYRHNNEWKFNAIGSGFQGGLASLITEFGLS
ncbi:TerD family protein [Psychrobacillus psychrodurans]|jgi:tellurium resistance protein TerD|uniref:TerD family protein n=1 Tax=Psychrobacillus psychrodurans TaxID=126157 RepID=UPI0008EEC7B0|nr:TerD family protein [Psychrobacillus psychrodurans]MCZ8538711.1 TerD family protein [Psychrobacillus psychrodurans]SFM20435.1 tellurium resistance protein TerD [Psychrobacillus psychrodurans]